MKSKITIAFLLFGTYLSSAQNLIRNGSFEDTLACPPSVGFINYCEYWYTDQAISTSDYFHPCSSFMATPYSADVTNQIPYEGDGYIGLILFSVGFMDNNYTEFASSKLYENVEKDSFYCFSGYINLNDYSGYKSSLLQVVLSGDSLPVVPRPSLFVDSPSLSFNIYDVNNIDWFPLKGGFFSNSDCQFIHIGNFLDTSQYQHEGPLPDAGNLFNIYSYYLLDSLSLYKLPKPQLSLTYDCDLLNAEVTGADSVKWYNLGQSGTPLSTGTQFSVGQLVVGSRYIAVYWLCSYMFTDTLIIPECQEPLPVIPDIITPNGDGVNDAFAIGNLPPYTALTVYNRWGAQVFRTDNYNNDWRGETRTLGVPTQVTDGVYFYVLTLPGGMQKTGTLTVTGH